MKFTIVFTTLLCVSTSWAVQAKKVEDPKDKRETQVSYGVPGYSSQGYQAPAAYSQGDASAISVGAGYSIGGAKPSYSFGVPGSSASLQIPSEGLSPNGHGTIRLPPITLQSSHGAFQAGDLSQIMNQLSHSLNAGGLSLQPSAAIAEFHQGGEGAQAISQGQELSVPQFAYGVPKYELSQQQPSSSGYQAGTKGLGSYTSTGPVLFNPADSHSNAAAAPALTYGAASSGEAGSYSLGNAGHSFGGAGHSLGGAGQSLGGHSFGGSAHSLGASGLSLGDSGLSLGSSGHSLAGLSHGGAGHSFGGSYKQLSSGGYAAPSKTSFKPSAFIGSSAQGESGHAISSPSASYSAPSFGGYRGSSHGGLSGLSLSSGHGHSFGGSLGGFGSGSSKFVVPVYQSSKSEGLEGANALSSGHYASPPGTTYGIPTSSYSSNNAHAASSNRPYYITKHLRASAGGFGHGSSAFKAPISSHSSLGSYSSGPKYSFAASGSHYEPHDAHVSASETSYNTIKYSEPMKAHVN